MPASFVRPRPGVEYDAATGKLYVFKRRSIAVMAAWPQPMAWLKTARMPAWRRFRPPIERVPCGAPGDDLARHAELIEIVEKIDPQAIHAVPGSVIKHVAELVAGPHAELMEDYSSYLLENPNRLISKVIGWRQRLAWLRWFDAIPEEVRDIVHPFPDRQWHLLSMMARCGTPAMDLARSNPALAYALASNWVFHRPAVKRPLRAARALLTRKQTHILDWLGFPGTNAMRKILAKIPHESISIFALLFLRRRARNATLLRALSHLPRVNLGVLRLAADPELQAVVTPSLLNEASDRPDDVRDDITRLEVHKIMQAYRRAHPRRAFPKPRSLSELIEWEQSLGVSECKSQAKAGNREFGAPPIPGTEDIVPISSERELVMEGMTQRNCVAKYAEIIGADAGVYFYSVLRPERCTLFLTNDGERWRINGLMRKCNEQASPESWAAVEQWAKGSPST